MTEPPGLFRWPRLLNTGIWRGVRAWMSVWGICCSKWRLPGRVRKAVVETSPQVESQWSALIESGMRYRSVTIGLDDQVDPEPARCLDCAGTPDLGLGVVRFPRAVVFILLCCAKAADGIQHEDRDAQFGYLAHQAAEHVTASHPVMSVDTNEELVGNFLTVARNTGGPEGRSVST